MGQALGPREDRRDRIRRCRLALLVLAEVTGDRAMRSLGLHCLAVRRHEHRCHEAERAEALRDRVGLNVAVVVLARPDVAALPLHGRSDHVVDKPVLIGDARRLELLAELGLVDLSEDVLELAVVGLEDGVLRREVDGVIAGEAIAHGGAGEVANRVVEVVHAHRDPGAREVEDVELHRLRAVGRREGHRERAG